MHAVIVILIKLLPDSCYHADFGGAQHEGVLQLVCMIIGVLTLLLWSKYDGLNDRALVYEYMFLILSPVGL